MSVELSRRLAKVVLFEPIRSLPPGDRKGIADAAEDSISFSDLPPRYQQMILAAEELRARRIADDAAARASA